MAAASATIESLLQRQHVLVERNVEFLRQGLHLLSRIDDQTYAEVPRGLAPHRVGGHMRHCIEFYECFLDGLQWSHIDYDSRRRDQSVETLRTRAMTRLRSLIDRLETTPLFRGDPVVWVRIEDARECSAEQSWMISTVSRELQVLASHTVHHFALIAMTLRALGVEVDEEFGVALSTLRRRAEVAPCAQ